MRNQFCSYEIALKLKELGFDEKCFATYYGVNNELHGFPLADMGGELIVDTFEEPATTFKYAWQNSKVHIHVICAPLWQQVIDWLRGNHNIIIYVATCEKNKHLWQLMNYGEVELTDVSELCDSYEEAREFAILKAIELIKTNKC